MEIVVGKGGQGWMAFMPCIKNQWSPMSKLHPLSLYYPCCYDWSRIIKLLFYRHSYQKQLSSISTSMIAYYYKHLNSFRHILCYYDCVLQSLVISSWAGNIYSLVVAKCALKHTVLAKQYRTVVNLTFKALKSCAGFFWPALYFSQTDKKYNKTLFIQTLWFGGLWQGDMIENELIFVANFFEMFY